MPLVSRTDVVGFEDSYRHAFILSRGHIVSFRETMRHSVALLLRAAWGRKKPRHLAGVSNLRTNPSAHYDAD